VTTGVATAHDTTVCLAVNDRAAQPSARAAENSIHERVMM
jgi:hypothetical protein